MADRDKRSDVQRERDRELDDFWDISRLLPDKPRRQAPLPRRSTPPDGVEIELPVPENGAKPLPAADPGTADISAPVRDVPLPPHPADGADAGGSLDGQQKDHGKGGHGPAAVTANLPKQNAAQVKVGQRITAHHRPGPKALIFGYT